MLTLNKINIIKPCSKQISRLCKSSVTLLPKAAQYAKDNKIDVIVNDESAFFDNPDLDVSSKVVALMDQQHEKKASELKTPRHQLLQGHNN